MQWDRISAVPGLDDSLLIQASILTTFATATLLAASSSDGTCGGRCGALPGEPALLCRWLVPAGLTPNALYLLLLPLLDLPAVWIDRHLRFFCCCFHLSLTALARCGGAALFI